jgi:hypothetical protein
MEAAQILVTIANNDVQKGNSTLAEQVSASSSASRSAAVAP